MLISHLSCLPLDKSPRCHKPQFSCLWVRNDDSTHRKQAQNSKIPAGRQEAGKPSPALCRSSVKAGTGPVSLHSEISNSQQARQLGSMGNWTFTSVSKLVSIQDHPPESMKKHAYVTEKIRIRITRRFLNNEAAS